MRDSRDRTDRLPAYGGLSFEWDTNKAVLNEAKHGVSFEYATWVFNDLGAIERMDDRVDYGEDRYVIVGMVKGTVLFVAYTERNCVYRLISARRATKREQDDYFTQNA